MTAVVCPVDLMMTGSCDSFGSWNLTCWTLAMMSVSAWLGS